MSNYKKPINYKDDGCTPTSSNCIIWQGPDISCLNLCKGDTISDVIFKLACLVCEIKDQLNVDSYDLTCLDLDKCDIPKSYKELLQLIIDKICELQSLIVPSEQEAGAESILVVASCFSALLGPSATISNYVTAIGQKLCEQEITIQNQQLAIQQLVARVTILEG